METPTQEPPTQEPPLGFDIRRFFESFLVVGREILFRPRAFFAQLQPTGSIINPLVFLVLTSFLASLLLANALSGGLRLFLALFFSNAVAVLAGGFVFHNLAKRIFKLNVPFEATFCIIAYASITDLAAWVQLLGVIANFYGIYLIFLGFQIILRLTPGRAVAAVFLGLVIIGMIRMMILSYTAQDLIQAMIQNIDPSQTDALGGKPSAADTSSSSNALQ